MTGLIVMYVLGLMSVISLRDAPIEGRKQWVVMLSWPVWGPAAFLLKVWQEGGWPWRK